MVWLVLMVFIGLQMIYLHFHFRTLSQTVMVNIHLGYCIYNQLLQHLPHSDIKWLPEEIKLPKELIPIDCKLKLFKIVIYLIRPSRI